MSKKRFKMPCEVETIPGTEGWERMYPYYYLFATDKHPERKKYEESQLWYYDGIHNTTVFLPFDIITDDSWWPGLSAFNNRVFMIPSARGLDHRILHGYVYLTSIGVEDPKEVEKRIPLFTKRTGYYYENWEKIYDNFVKKVQKLIEEAKNMEFAKLPDMEDDSMIFEHKGITHTFILPYNYDKLINMQLEIFQYHFEMLNLCYAAYLTFLTTANKIFPDIPIQNVTKMVSGIDVILYKGDSELIRLAKLALELKIDNILEAYTDFEELKKKLEETEAGKKWLEEFEKAKDPWFYCSLGTGLTCRDKCWIDDLNIPLASIKMHMAEIKNGRKVGRDLEKMQEERDKITEGYLKLIKNKEERKAFEEALSIARRVFPFAENHTFYIENNFFCIFWQKIRELGKVLVDVEILKDPEDIFYMNRYEIRETLHDVVANWATGVSAAGKYYWPEEIEWRKEVIKKFEEWTPPPALGTPPEKVTEPFTIMLWGITTESINKWLSSAEGDTGEVNELHGIPGSPGKAKGKARIIKNAEELDLLEKGEILIAPTTSPTWAPAFPKVAGVVTDIGGAMSHAAIVCREYGLPTVVGTGNATSVIKTGDLIEIDGDEGIVKILERA